MKGRVTWFDIAWYQAALLAEHINANYAKGINATVMAYNAHLGILGRYFRYFIYLPHDYDNYKKMPKKKKNVGRDGEEA